MSFTPDPFSRIERYHVNPAAAQDGHTRRVTLKVDIDVFSCKQVYRGGGRIAVAVVRRDLRAGQPTFCPNGCVRNPCAAVGLTAAHKEGGIEGTSSLHVPN